MVSWSQTNAKSRGKSPLKKPRQPLRIFPFAKPRLAARAIVDAHPHDRGARRTTPASCRTPNPPRGASACPLHSRLPRRRFPRRRVVRCRLASSLGTHRSPRRPPRTRRSLFRAKAPPQAPLEPMNVNYRAQVRANPDTRLPDVRPRIPPSSHRAARRAFQKPAPV